MEWQDQAIILSAKPHGENNVVVELLTENHGRHAGMVRGGRSKKNRPMLQPGNHVSAVWKARLVEHLGFYTIELIQAHAAVLMEDRAALAGISSLCTLARYLPERDPHPGLFEACLLILQYIENREIWPPLLIRWEMELLNELGFQLDLSECAATGSKENLIYVSPKSGKAVSEVAGEPYKDKLLRIPDFLRDGAGDEGALEEINLGFQLTGYFLEKYILQVRNQTLPETRSRLLGYLKSQTS
ncbi:MAG: DNA repair protein RecO [Methyloligellaceae bacterium]